MDALTRILSAPINKPYRTKNLPSEPPFLNRDGFVDFSPGDMENPRNWSRNRRLVVTITAVFLVVNATFASSSPSGCFLSIAAYFHVSQEATSLTVTLFLLGYCAGPLLFAPLSELYGRRWDFYVLLWMGGLSALFMFTIPETRAPTILRLKAQRIRSLRIPGYEDVKAQVEAGNQSFKSVFKVALTRPWRILFDPISFLVAIYLSVVYVLLYMLFTIYPIVFQEMRGWNAGVGELPLIGIIIGALVAGFFVFLDGRRQQKMIDSGRTLEAEDRLPIAMVGGILFFISMFWFAWSANYNSVHWAVPSIAGIFIAISLLFLFVGFFNYLVDTYLMFAASAIAANTIIRSACGAAAPLFTSQMFGALGVGGGGSLVGGVAVLLSVIPFMFYKYGKAIRMRSKFAPTPQKQAMREKDEEA